MVKVSSLKANKIKNAALKKRAFFLSSGRLNGSMALEGSLALPLFLFFIMTVLLSLEAVRFQSNMQEALHQTGNQYAFAGYMEKYAKESFSDADGQIMSYLGNQIYPYLCVAGGEGGIQIQDLSTVDENGRVEIRVTYQIKPFIGWIPIGNVAIQDGFVSHAFIGYTGLETQNNRQQETYVYITKTGSKYHMSFDCIYLRIQVKAADYGSISSLRNSSGERYHACLRCKPQKDGVVYITAEGNRYHGQSDCSSLKRIVHMIPLSEAAGYGACSKCAG